MKGGVQVGLTTSGVQLRQTAEDGVHEQWCAVLIDDELVDVDFSDEKACSRNVEAVSSVMHLPGCQQIVEPPQVRTSGHPQSLL